jgi:hypothetical protein
MGIPQGGIFKGLEALGTVECWQAVLTVYVLLDVFDPVEEVREAGLVLYAVALVKGACKTPAPSLGVLLLWNFAVHSMVNLRLIVPISVVDLTTTFSRCPGRCRLRIRGVTR